MKIDNIKQLQKVIRLCKREGVEHIIVDGIEININLSYAAVKPKTGAKEIMPIYTPGGVTQDLKIETDELSEEQLMMWSVEGVGN